MYACIEQMRERAKKKNQRWILFGWANVAIVWRWWNDSMHIVLCEFIMNCEFTITLCAGTRLFLYIFHSNFHRSTFCILWHFLRGEHVHTSKFLREMWYCGVSGKKINSMKNIIGSGKKIFGIIWYGKCVPAMKPSKMPIVTFSISNEPSRPRILKIYKVISSFSHYLLFLFRAQHCRSNKINVQLKCMLSAWQPNWIKYVWVWMCAWSCMQCKSINDMKCMREIDEIRQFTRKKNGTCFFECEFFCSLFFCLYVVGIDGMMEYVWIQRLITFDQQFRPQTVVNKCTFHHLSHQHRLELYTMHEPSYRIKPSTKIAFKAWKIRTQTQKEKRRKDKTCKLIPEKMIREDI